MSSKIFFKFHSSAALQPDEISFEGMSMSLSDFKATVLGRTNEQGDLEVRNDLNNEIFSDDTPLPKNARVIVRRIPLKAVPKPPPAWARATQPKPAAAPAPAPATTPAKPADEDFGGDVFAEDDDEEENELARRIAADAERLAGSNNRHQGTARRFNNLTYQSGAQGAAGANAPSPATSGLYTGLASEFGKSATANRGRGRFLSQRAGVPGAPGAQPQTLGLYSGEDQRVVRVQRKRKAMAGVPKEFQGQLEADEDAEDDPSQPGLVMPGTSEPIKTVQVPASATGWNKFRTAVEVIAPKSRPLATLDEVRNRVKKEDIPKHLRCKLTDELLKEAVMMPCCFYICSFEPMQAALIKSGFVCPLCGKETKPDDLQPHESVRAEVEAFLVSVRDAQSGNGNSLLLSAASAAPVSTASSGVGVSALPSDNRYDAKLDFSETPALPVPDVAAPPMPQPSLAPVGAPVGMGVGGPAVPLPTPMIQNQWGNPNMNMQAYPQARPYGGMPPQPHRGGMLMPPQQQQPMMWNAGRGGFRGGAFPQMQRGGFAPRGAPGYPPYGFVRGRGNFRGNFQPGMGRGGFYNPNFHPDPNYGAAPQQPPHPQAFPQHDGGGALPLQAAEASAAPPGGAEHAPHVSGAPAPIEATVEAVSEHRPVENKRSRSRDRSRDRRAPAEPPAPQHHRRGDEPEDANRFDRRRGRSREPAPREAPKARPAPGASAGNNNKPPVGSNGDKPEGNNPNGGNGGRRNRARSRDRRDRRRGGGGGGPPKHADSRDRSRERIREKYAPASKRARVEEDKKKPRGHGARE